MLDSLKDSDESHKENEAIMDKEYDTMDDFVEKLVLQIEQLKEIKRRLSCINSLSESAID